MKIDGGLPYKWEGKGGIKEKKTKVVKEESRDYQLYYTPYINKEQ